MKITENKFIRAVFYFALINGLFDLFELVFEKLFVQLLVKKYPKISQRRPCSKQSALKGGK